ncbi:MAG: ATP-dependent DNA ligase [Longimicrobiales bacterium]
METKLADVVGISTQVASTTRRLEKIASLAALLRQLEPAEIPIAVSFLVGELRQGRIGIGWAMLRETKPDGAAPRPMLTLRAVDGTFDRISQVKGAGSTRERGRLLHELLAAATAEEQDFLGRLLFGELRQGAQEGVMLDAIARAAEVPASTVRRAHLIAGDLVSVAAAALTGGAPALAAFSVQVFRPLQPMLADSAEDVDDALQQLGRGAFEYKLDGARIQVHKSGADVRIFSRQLNDVTASAPELVEIVQALPARELVLDGEAIVLRENGKPQPFQITMSRFSRKLDLDRLRRQLPLQSFFFDLLHVDGETLIDRPGAERFQALAAAVPGSVLIPRQITDRPEQAAAFLEAARSAGHEGLVAKALDGTYDAGRRGSSWLKVKFTETLDLVVLAVEWGSGRRQGWLSNLHLGARDPGTGSFVMLGKTFKGLTDALLEWQTRELLQRELSRNEYTVFVKPELVVEIAFDDIQASSRYPGGFALRFARVKRYRPDKRAEESDTIGRIRKLYARRNG